MKKFLLPIALIFMGLILNSNQANAQDFGVTLGLGYGTEIEQPGVQVGGFYWINENIRATADFVYFFPESEEGVDISWWEINLNGHYMLLNDDKMRAYGLAGLNYATLKVEFDFFGSSFSGTDSEVGLNLGAGFEYDITDSIPLYVEAKYVLGNADQLGVFAGVRFSF